MALEATIQPPPLRTAEYAKVQAARQAMQTPVECRAPGRLRSAGISVMVVRRDSQRKRPPRARQQAKRIGVCGSEEKWAGLPRRRRSVAFSCARCRRDECLIDRGRGCQSFPPSAAGAKVRSGAAVRRDASVVPRAVPHGAGAGASHAMLKPRAVATCATR